MSFYAIKSMFDVAACSFTSVRAGVRQKQKK